MNTRVRFSEKDKCGPFYNDPKGSSRRLWCDTYVRIIPEASWDPDPDVEYEVVEIEMLQPTKRQKDGGCLGTRIVRAIDATRDEAPYKARRAEQAERNRSMDRIRPALDRLRHIPIYAQALMLPENFWYAEDHLRQFSRGTTDIMPLTIQLLDALDRLSDEMFATAAKWIRQATQASLNAAEQEEKETEELTQTIQKLKRQLSPGSLKTAEINHRGRSVSIRSDMCFLDSIRVTGEISSPDERGTRMSSYMSSEWRPITDQGLHSRALKEFGYEVVKIQKELDTAQRLLDQLQSTINQGKRAAWYAEMAKAGGEIPLAAKKVKDYKMFVEAVRRESRHSSA